MPRSVFGKDFQFLARSELLTHEEIERAAKVFVSLGVEKIRITGGEPLLRKDVDMLASRLVALTTHKGRPVDRKTDVEGQSVSVRVALGGSRFLKKKKSRVHNIT